MLIEFLAQYPTERIPIALVEGAIKDKSERERAIAALKMASLLSSDSCDDGTTAVKLHRLVRAAVRVRSERERQ
jgi:hypothetical protein